MLALVAALLLSVFTPPVDYEISLAGNFGEPRPHHFHGGLDIRTGGVEGKHVYAIGDGYVSRITVGYFGFGNAVYVTHPTGHTSVYCHLRSFSPRIAALLRKWQYTHQSYLADVQLSPLDCPVSQGQYLALSGNTGHSTAPHLHLEIHDTQTWNMLDPYQFLNDFIQDTVPPRAHAFMACPQEGGTFCGSSQKQTFGFSSHELERSFTAWGPVGFALWADDYMQGSYNHYGVRETVLRVDGQEVFHSVVDDIPVGLNRMVNSWGDYDHWLRSHVWYMKSFVEPGNTLPLFFVGPTRGVVDFCDERDYQLEYLLRDYKGNESAYTFTVSASPTGTASTTATTRRLGPGAKRLHWDRTEMVAQPGMQLVVPYGLLAADVVVTPLVSRRPDALSDAYTFAQKSTPLMTDAQLSLYAKRAVPDPSKLYVATHDGRYMGGTYKDGWVTSQIRDLGRQYALAYDDEPPTVRPVTLTDRLVFSVTDAQSGVASYKAFVDGQFVLLEEVPRSSLLACRLADTPLRRLGRDRRLKLIVADRRNNVRTYETTINY